MIVKSDLTMITMVSLCERNDDDALLLPVCISSSFNMGTALGRWILLLLLLIMLLRVRIRLIGYGYLRESFNCLILTFVYHQVTI